MSVSFRCPFLLTRYRHIFSSYPSLMFSSQPPDKSSEDKKKILSKTPLGKLDELKKHPYAEKEPLPEFKDGVNPKTGEVGGPRGPEPTRYGDWERKGRVTDF